MKLPKPTQTGTIALASMLSIVLLILAILMALYLFNMSGSPNSLASFGFGDNAYKIYSDELNSNWTNQSWGGRVNLDNRTDFYSGTSAISLTADANSTGLYLRAKQPFDLTGYHSLHFAAKASRLDLKFDVLVYDEHSQPHAISLDNYGGDPFPDSWHTYDLSLNIFQLPSQLINGLAIREVTSANPVWTLNIDSLQFR